MDSSSEDFLTAPAGSFLPDLHKKLYEYIELHISYLVSENCSCIFRSLELYYPHTNLYICMQKVGAGLSKLEILKSVFCVVGEVAKTSDFIAAGIPKAEVAALCKQGYIERIKKGYYRLPGDETVQEEILLVNLLPQAVVCLESALFHYGYSDFTPREWTVSVPRSAYRALKAAQAEIPVKAYYGPDELRTLGVTAGQFNGVTLPVYDRERTICDCFHYRTKLDHELFSKAINAYVKDEHKNLPNLARYAKQLGIYKNMMDVMEVLLNG